MILFWAILIFLLATNIVIFINDVKNSRLIRKIIKKSEINTMKNGVISYYIFGVINIFSIVKFHFDNENMKNFSMNNYFLFGLKIWSKTISINDEK